MSEQLLLSEMILDHLHTYHPCTAPGARVFENLLLSFWLQQRGSLLAVHVEAAAPNMTGETVPVLNSAPRHWGV